MWRRVRPTVPHTNGISQALSLAKHFSPREKRCGDASHSELRRLSRGRTSCEIRWRKLADLVSYSRSTLGGELASLLASSRLKGSPFGLRRWTMVWRRPRRRCLSRGVCRCRRRRSSGCGRCRRCGSRCRTHRSCSCSCWRRCGSGRSRRFCPGASSERFRGGARLYLKRRAGVNTIFTIY
jgi:hypothetical protein